MAINYQVMYHLSSSQLPAQRATVLAGVGATGVWAAAGVGRGRRAGAGTLRCPTALWAAVVAQHWDTARAVGHGCGPQQAWARAGLLTGGGGWVDPTHACHGKNYKNYGIFT